jgi:hypothetical protein
MKGEPPLETNSAGEAGASQELLRPQVRVEPLPDPLVEAHGFGPRSLYVEACWLPVLGPTATWLYRRLGTWVETSPEGVEIDLVDLAVSLGLGEGLGRHSLLAKGLGRLSRFDAARWQNDKLAVRRALAPLPERQTHRLSASAYQLHRQLSTHPAGASATW